MQQNMNVEYLNYEKGFLLYFECFIVLGAKMVLIKYQNNFID